MSPPGFCKPLSFKTASNGTGIFVHAAHLRLKSFHGPIPQPQIQNTKSAKRTRQSFKPPKSTPQPTQPTQPPKLQNQGTPTPKAIVPTPNKKNQGLTMFNSLLVDPKTIFRLQLPNTPKTSVFKSPPKPQTPKKPQNSQTRPQSPQTPKTPKTPKKPSSPQSNKPPCRNKFKEYPQQPRKLPFLPSRNLTKGRPVSFQKPSRVPQAFGCGKNTPQTHGQRSHPVHQLLHVLPNTPSKR